MAKGYSDRGNLVLADLVYSTHTDVGVKRSENQDNFAVIEGEGFRFFCVADGMGGAKSGGLASQLAVDSLRASLNKGYITRYDLSLAVENANRVIYEQSQESPDKSGMGTTLVGLCFTGVEFYIVNVGDSRAYRIRNSKIEQLTVDHSLVQELIKAGAISSESRETNPISHMLTRSLGPSQQVQVDCIVASKTVCQGDTFILCSDGLYNLVSDDEILQVVQSHTLEQAGAILVDLANRYGGSDNITVVLIRAGNSFPEYDPEVEQREINQSHPTDTIEFDSDKLAKALRSRRRKNILRAFKKHRQIAIATLGSLLALTLLIQFFIVKREKISKSALQQGQEQVPAVDYDDNPFIDVENSNWLVSSKRTKPDLQVISLTTTADSERWHNQQQEVDRVIQTGDLASLAIATDSAQKQLQSIKESKIKIEAELKQAVVKLEEMLRDYQFSKFDELLKIADQFKATDPLLAQALSDFQSVSWRYLQSGSSSDGAEKGADNLLELRSLAVKRLREQVRSGLALKLEQVNQDLDHLALKRAQLAQEQAKAEAALSALGQKIHSLR